MREKRDEIIILRTTKAEKNRIYEKMLGMGIRSLSAYIRKMALDTNALLATSFSSSCLEDRKYRLPHRIVPIPSDHVKPIK